MPQKVYPNQKVEARISRLVYAGSEVNQLAWCWKFKTVEAADGSLQVLMDLWIIPYAVDTTAADGWGACLDGVGPYQRRAAVLRADNDTLVACPDDPTSLDFGKILAVKNRSTPEAWQAVLDSTTVQWMYQGDFMSYVRDNYPQVVGQVQRYHIMQADAAGEFTPAAPTA